VKEVGIGVNRLSASDFASPRLTHRAAPFLAKLALFNSTVTLSLFAEGKHYAALEARSMVAGAFAFFGYTLACVYLMGKRHLRAAPTTVALLVVWGIFALVFWSLFLR